jgi:hypothetical protein
MRPGMVGMQRTPPSAGSMILSAGLAGMESAVPPRPSAEHKNAPGHKRLWHLFDAAIEVRPVPGRLAAVTETHECLQ